MAIYPGKGSSFSVDTGGGAAAVSQVITITPPEGENETFEADYLGNTDAGIPYKPTGRSEGGSASAELWLDTSSHSGLIGMLASPKTEAFSCTIAFPTGGLSFNGAGISFGGGSVALNDGIKASLSVKLDGVALVTGSGT